MQEIESLRKDTKTLIDRMQTDPTNPDYWFNDEIPEGWYKTDDVAPAGPVKRFATLHLWLFKN